MGEEQRGNTKRKDSMIMGRLAYLAGLAVISMVLLHVAARRDRFLGLIVAGSLILRLLGSIGVGIYLEEARGRDYLAEDEPSYQLAGEQILAEWEGGVRYEDRYQTALRGSYPVWNAFVIWLWGPSLLPMRLANNVVATGGVIIAFLLARHLFPGVFPARVAALLVVLSPSLLVWSIINLRETFLWVGVSAVTLSALQLLRRWGWQRLAMLLVTLTLLGSVRRYYAVVLGWLILLSYLIIGNLPVHRRVFRMAVLAVGIGWALYIFTESMLGVSVGGETLARYVVTEGFNVSTEYVSFPPDPLLVISNLPYVLFGRFDARLGFGQLMSLLLLPEWLASFLIIPLAIWGLKAQVRLGLYEALLPAAFIVVLTIVLAWLHGDPWTTFRFRLIYWPLVLVLAGGGVGLVLKAQTLSRPSITEIPKRGMISRTISC